MTTDWSPELIARIGAAQRERRQMDQREADRERWRKALIERLRKVRPGHGYQLDPVELEIVLEALQRC